jgi:hypothetical protein
MKTAFRMAPIVCLALALSSPAWAGPGAHGPNGEHLDTPAGASNASGLARLPDGSVNAPKLAQRRMGVRTVLAPLTQAAAAVELNGRVVIDPNAGGRVQAVHGGRVEPGPQGLPAAGQAVRKGQVLAWLHHHADPIVLGSQQAQLAELRTNREIAEQRLRRLETLEGTTPRKDIEAARAELAGLQARERSIGASINTRETVVAPVSGVIARSSVLVGQVVEERGLMFEIVDPQRLLVEATVTDPGLASRIESAQLSGQGAWRLTPVGVGRVLQDGVVPLTLRAQAQGADAPALAVGQPVTVVARLKDRIEGIVLSAAAVVRNPSNEPVVWIKTGAERYTPQPVEYRALDATTVVVTKGLAADNRVVVQGAALINQVR